MSKMKIELMQAESVSTEMLDAIPVRGCISVRLPSFAECVKARQTANTMTLRSGKSSGWMLRTMMHPTSPIIYIHKIKTYE